MRKQLTITISPAIRQEAGVLASVESLKMSELCEKAIAQYLEINRQKIIDFYKNNYTAA